MEHQIQIIVIPNKTLTQVIVLTTGFATFFKCSENDVCAEEEFIVDYKETGNTPHCVYNVDYDKKTGVFVGMNSHGPHNPHPLVDLGDVRHIYKVSGIVTSGSRYTRFLPKRLYTNK